MIRGQDRAALDTFKTGFDNGVYKFVVAFDSAEGVKAALDHVGEYNSFDAEAAKRAVDELARHEDELTALGGIKFSAGLEGSPVVYATQLNRDGAERAQLVFAAARADEVDEVHGAGAGTSFGLSVRAWWD